MCSVEVEAFTFNYFVPIETGELDLRVEYSYTDEQNMSLTNTSVKLEEVKTVNASINWSPTENISLSLWGKNLTDEADIIHVYTVGPGTIGVWGEPRTFGLTATYTYE